MVVFCISVALAGCGGGASSSEPEGSKAAATQSTESDAQSNQAPSKSPESEAGPSDNVLTHGKPEKPTKLTKPDVQPPEEVPTELVINDLKEGSGPAAEPGDELTTEYLAVNEDGETVYSSWEKGTEKQLSFELGAGTSYPGMEDGLEGMKVGGRRELLLPADLTKTAGLVKDPGPLVYVIDLVELDRGGHCWASQAITQNEYGHEHLAAIDCDTRVRLS